MFVIVDQFNSPEIGLANKFLLFAVLSIFLVGSRDRDLNLETALQIAHLPLLASAFILKHRGLAVLAGTVSAGSFTLRALSDEEEPTYMRAMNRLLIPVSLIGGWGATRLVLKSQAKRSIFRAWSEKGWRQRYAELDALVGFTLSRVIDGHAHIRRGENPLMSYNFWIGTAYNVMGAFIGRYVLIRSDTFKNRLIAAGALSAAYTYTNIWTQEMQGLIFGAEFDHRNLRFDNQWGIFHSSPRNLAYWATWNAIAGTKILPPAFISTVLSGMHVIDGLQRKYWYANAKLDYIRHEDVTFIQALFGGIHEKESHKQKTIDVKREID